MMRGSALIVGWLGLSVAASVGGASWGSNLPTPVMGDDGPESVTALTRFARVVAGGGDVNGDGYADVVAGDASVPSASRAHVFYGSSTGVPLTPAWSSQQSSTGFGQSVTILGDVNGDGYADIAIGAPYAEPGGRVYVFHGSVGGVAAVAAWSSGGPNGSSFGFAVAGAGDINGDGYADLLVGAPDVTAFGAVYLYYGSASGLSATPNWTFYGTSVTRVGSSVSGLHDVNADGYADIAMGSPTYSSSTGRVLVFYGSAAGVSGVSTLLTGPSTSAQFGAAIAGAGDVNGDGFADVLVGAPGHHSARLHLGAAGGVLTTASWVGTGTGSYGATVASAGDVDGDGFADVVVGPSGAQIYRGSAAGLQAQPVMTLTPPVDSITSVAGLGDVNGDGYSDIGIGGSGTAAGDPSYSLPVVTLCQPQWPSTVGPLRLDGAGHGFGVGIATADVNADGFDDLVVGTPGYSNGQNAEGRVELYLGSPAGLSATRVWAYEADQADAELGDSVANAGDVNGDGYADIVVGAHRYRNASGSRVGWAALFLGTASGLSTTPNWTFLGLATNQAFGRSVAGAGDVNGDAFADVVIGASGYSNGQAGEGAAFLFYGSLTGLGATPAWTWEPNIASVAAGTAVSSGGDVNGDGFADILVGAPYYPRSTPDQGRAYAFYGGPLGLPASPSVSIPTVGSAPYFGASLAAAGDVNGDGFSDVLIGYGTSVTNQIALLLGSALGLSAQPSWTTYAGVVGACGDVNGDGLADLITATPSLSPGRASLFPGTLAGSSAEAVWTASGGTSGSNFGSALSAGDFDADGLADLVISAPNEVLAGSYSGVVRIYYGNGGAGRYQLPTQLRGGAVATRVPPWGTSGSPVEFRVEQRATSAVGRQRSKIEAEACPPGIRFGLPGCSRAVSNVWVDTGLGGSTRLSISGLAPGTLYRWRTRSLSAPFAGTQNGVTPSPHPAHGPWRRLAAQTREADIRTTQGLVADLAVVKGNGLATSTPGTLVVYQITVSNAGPSNVAGATVADPIPFGLTGAWWTCTPTSGSICTTGPTSGGINDTVSVLAGGVLTYTLQATVRPDSRGTLSNSVTVQAPEGIVDPYLANNTSTDTDTLTPLSDLRVTQHDSPDPAPVGGNITYTIAAQNTGPSDASGVVLTDTLSAGLTFVSATPAAACQYASGTLTCSLGTVPAGSTSTVALTARANAGVRGTVSSVGTVAASEPDPISTNNSALEMTTIRFVKGDANNDLSPDIYFRNGATGQQQIWFMNEVTAIGSGTLPSSPNLDWRIVGVDDFNGDLWNDLVVWNISTGALQFWTMTGPYGTAQSGPPIPLAPASRTPDWVPSATADLDYDGKPDILWRNTTTQKLEVWLMNGTSMFATKIPSPDQAADANWSVSATLDYSGDGLVDLLWYNSTSGKIVLWFMDVNMVRTAGLFTNPANAGDNNWKVVAGGDYGVGVNGLPNTNDIVWRNDTSGNLVVWHMDQSGNRTSGRFTTPSSPADPLNWFVVGPK